MPDTVREAPDAGRAVPVCAGRNADDAGCEAPDAAPVTGRVEPAAASVEGRAASVEGRVAPVSAPDEGRASFDAERDTPAVFAGRALCAAPDAVPDAAPVAGLAAPVGAVRVSPVSAPSVSASAVREDEVCPTFTVRAALAAGRAVPVCVPDAGRAVPVGAGRDTDDAGREAPDAAPDAGRVEPAAASVEGRTASVEGRVAPVSAPDEGHASLDAERDTPAVFAGRALCAAPDAAPVAGLAAPLTAAFAGRSPDTVLSAGLAPPVTCGRAFAFFFGSISIASSSSYSYPYDALSENSAPRAPVSRSPFLSVSFICDLLFSF